MGDKNEQQIIEQTIDLLKTFQSQALPCLQSAKALLAKLQDNQLATEDGINLLDLKNKLFTNYLLDLTLITSQKLNGDSIEQGETRERLVEERVVLEKIRPIEHKLKYQIDKLVKVLNTGVIDKDDPLNAKPNFAGLLEDEEEEDNEDNNNNNKDDEEDKTKVGKTSKPGVYVPPRVAQMKFEDEEDKRNRNLERAKKRALNSSIFKELRREFDDAPEEEHDTLLHQKSGIGKYLKEKKRYEEENFIRLNLTKKQKAEARRVKTVNTIGDDITRFEDISVLDSRNNSRTTTPKGKKTGKPGKRKTLGKKKGFKKRKH